MTAAALEQGLTAIGNEAMALPGQIADFGGALGKEALALPGQAMQGLEGLFGMNKGAGATGAATGPTGASMTNVVPSVEKAAGAVSAAPGASAVASADPAALNFNFDPTKFAQSSGVGSDCVPMGVAPTQAASIGAPATAAAATPAVAPTAAAAPVADEFASHMLNANAGAQSADPMMAKLGLQSPFAAAAPTAGGVQGLVNNLMSPGVLKYAIPAGLAGLDIANATKSPPGVKAMQQELARAQGEKSMLGARTAAEQAGQLPQAAQDTVDRAVQQNIAAIKQRYAAAGMSGSSAEQADIANAQAQGLQESFALGQSMAQQGLAQVTQDQGTINTLLAQILNAQSAQDTELGNTLSELAFMSAGGNPFGRGAASGAK